MIKYYKTFGHTISELLEPQEDCWINLTNPTKDEIEYISSEFSVPQDYLMAALDEEEASRAETDEGVTLVVIDIPYTEKTDEIITYQTIPLGIIVSNKLMITVCLSENLVLDDFAENRVKGVSTAFKTRFILQILYRVAGRYLQYLRQIDRLSSHIEQKLHVSMKNKELIQLLDLEKSLVFFSTSLKSDEVTIEKIMRGRLIKMYEEDQDLLEDVLIEFKQAIEMASIYSNILSGTMDAFASIISNNLNIVMKTLTLITILISVPTMFASFYGMNVTNIPFANFWAVTGIALVVTVLVGCLLFRSKRLK